MFNCKNFDKCRSRFSYGAYFKYCVGVNVMMAMSFGSFQHIS